MFLAHSRVRLGDEVVIILLLYVSLLWRICLCGLLAFPGFLLNSSGPVDKILNCALKTFPFTLSTLLNFLLCTVPPSFFSHVSAMF